MFNSIKKITFEITNRCLLRCRICNIWQEEKKRDLSVAHLERFFPIFDHPVCVSLTGGEPFLHPDLDQMYKRLFRLYLQKKISWIDIATSGYPQAISKFLENNKTLLRPLSLSVSLDGIGAAHNRQRGRTDAFERTVRAIALMKKYRIPVSLKFVITKLNCKDLRNVYLLSKKIRCGLHLKFYEHLASYYHREGGKTELSVDAGQRQEALAVIEEIRDKERNKIQGDFVDFELSSLEKFSKVNNLDFITKCGTPRYTLFVTCRGDVYSCLYQGRIGRIGRRLELDVKLFGSIAEKAQHGECPKCLSYHGYLREFNMP